MHHEPSSAYSVPKPDTWWRKEGRMRPTLRALLFVPAFIAIFFVTYLVVGLLVFAGMAITGHHSFDLAGIIGGREVQEVVQSAAVVLASWLFCRFLEKRSWLDLGYRVTAANLRQGLGGWAFGGGMQVAVVLLGLATGVYTLTWNWGLHGSASRWLLYFVTMAFVAFSEEGLLRGYLLQTLAAGLGKWPAAIITALIFGALHLANPDAGLASTLGITVFGLWAAYAVFTTRSMWLAMGMHMMWNVFEGVVFGLPNSGNPESYAIWITNAHGPEWWTGGGFGPEAGVLSTIALVLGFAVLYAWQRRKRQAAA